MLKNTLVTLGIVVALGLGVANYGKPVEVNVSPTPVNVDVSPTPVSLNVPKQDAPVVNVAAPTVTPSVQNLGAVSGPDYYGPYLGLNGVRTFSTSKEFTTSTTTVCAIRAPINSTSTLQMGGALFTTGSTTATTVTIAKAATAFATTTRLGQGAIAANGQGFLLASTTATTAGGTGSNMNPDFVFGPGQWLVVGMQGGVGNFSPVGQCQASFVSWN